MRVCVCVCACIGIQVDVVMHDVPHRDVRIGTYARVCAREIGESGTTPTKGVAVRHVNTSDAEKNVTNACASVWIACRHVHVHT